MPKIIKLTEKQSKRVLLYLSNRLMRNGNNTELQSYMLARDVAYARWTNAVDANKEDFVVPLLLSQVSSAQAKLANIFLTTAPIFSVVSPVSMQSVAEQYTAIYEADINRYGWGQELNINFIDGLKYNLLANEVTWNIELGPAPAPVENAGTQAQAETVITYQGNKLKRLDLYNTFFDMGCKPREIHKEGDYAGYIELWTATRLDRELNKLGLTVAEQKVLYENIKINQIRHYQTPNLSCGSQTVTPEESAIDFDLDDAEIRTSKRQPSGMYEITTLYFRRIPEDLLLTKNQIANLHTQSIFKALVVGGDVIIHFSQLDDDHGMLPIVFSQMIDEGLGLQTKSFTHSLEDLQRVATMLIQAEIKSNRRMLTDRAIYDPLIINKRDVNSPNATAKIPMRSSAIGRSLTEAYYPIPYRDDALGTRIQQAANLLSFGDQISGLNPAMQGQFVKGNKTNDQFQESMASSGQRIMAMAMALKNNFITPIELITKANILQFQPADKALSTSLRREVTIQPEELKKLDAQFKIADGLLPADRIASSELITAAIQIIPTIPEMAMQYSVPRMITHMLSLRGLRNLDDYRLSPEEVQAKQQQQLQLAQAQAGQQAPAQQPGLPANASATS